MLVLLSSAPPSRPRYADDIVRALALPVGGQMQFRYARQWVAPSVIDRIPRERLAEEPILICFLADTGSDSFEIIPIRFARLIRAEAIGTSCVFIFEAAGFASDLNDNLVRSAVNSAISAKLPGSVPASEAYFAFDASISPPIPPHVLDLAKFEQAVAKVASHAPFSSEDAVFFSVFRLSHAYKFSWFGTWPNPIRPFRALMGAYALASGKRYECEVYCLRPNDPKPGKKPAKLKLSVSPHNDQLSFLSAAQADVDSRYDVKRFVLQSDVGVFDRLSGFTLSITDAVNGTLSREVALPIIFRRNWWLFWGKLAVAGTASAAASILALDAAGKLTQVSFVAAAVLGALAGIAAVFPSIRKPQDT